MKTQAVFLDRDGTLNRDIGFVTTPKELILLPTVIEGLRVLQEAGFLLLVVTNQSGVARGLYTETGLAAIHGRLRTLLASSGVQLDGIYYCPHHPEEGRPPYRQACACRKPQPGLVEQAAREHQVDLSRSFLIGDQSRDIATAQAAGVRSILIHTGLPPPTNPPHPLPDYVAPDLLTAARWILDHRDGA